MARDVSQLQFSRARGVVKFRSMRHFVFGKDGRANVLEDGNSFLVAIDRTAKTIYEWNRKARFYLPGGQLLGEYDIPDTAAYAQLVADWNANVEAIRYGTARKMVRGGKDVIATTIRSTATPVLETENSNQLLQINNQLLVVNGSYLVVNAPAIAP